MKIIMPMNFINCILLLNYLYILSEWWILVGVHFLNPDGCPGRSVIGLEDIDRYPSARHYQCTNISKYHHT